MEYPRIERVWFTDNRIWIAASDGSQLSQPLELFPALLLAGPEERNNYYVWDDNSSIRWEKLDEDIHISHFYETERVNYDNEVNDLLSRFPWLDMKEFAQFIGMHWTKLARFRYGVWTPSTETVEKIRKGINDLGRMMCEAG